MVIKTLADIDISKINLNNEQKKIFLRVTMHKSDNQSFEISNTKIANELVMLDVIKKETIRIKSEDPEDCLGYHEPTGKYIITPEGILYRDNINNHKRSKFWIEFRAWITLAIAILGVALSIISLIVKTTPS